MFRDDSRVEFAIGIPTTGRICSQSPFYILCVVFNCIADTGSNNVRILCMMMFPGGVNNQNALRESQYEKIGNVLYYHFGSLYFILIFNPVWLIWHNILLTHRPAER